MASRVIIELTMNKNLKYTSEHKTSIKIHKQKRRKMKKQDEIKLVQEVTEDFKKRQLERRPFESQWQLNMNFLMGNQYCGVGFDNEVLQYDKQFFWQEREVFNHIATIIEMRLSKLNRVRPKMTVVPTSTDESDIKTAKLSKKIVNNIYNKEDMSNIIANATKWSEITGTSFYKIFWDNMSGITVAKDEDGNVLKTGDVGICAVSPFEIYPDSVSCEELRDCRSIIHAKAYDASEVERIWGKKVDGEDINVFSLDSTSRGLGGLDYTGIATKIISTTKPNNVVVIERYERPSINYPNGRLTIVASNTLLYNGELPYLNGSDGERDFPFVKQVCSPIMGSFWGSSIIERIIPVQRAYNAVKNRKHEFINRLSMGVLAVEDGSVDVENLEEEGLSPGKILVYRQGANAPGFMANAHVPPEFASEEEKLLTEFKVISGVSDLLNMTQTYANTSGVALQLLIEQDSARLSVTSDQVKFAIKEIARHILRLYKQFAMAPRLLKIVGDNGDLEMIYFNASDITSDDVAFEADSELNESLAQRRSMIFDLLNAGLLYDENGKLSNRMRIKALELLGFGLWENVQDINELHKNKAENENASFLSGKDVVVKEIDDHNIHIQEHIAFMLGGEYDKKHNSEIEKKLLDHIREHRRFLKLEKEIEKDEK